MTIREISPEEYAKNLRTQIDDDGIIKCVKDQVDEWVSICHPLGYLGFSESIERAQTIMDLLNTYIEMKKKHPKTDYEHQTLNLDDVNTEEPEEE